MGQGYSFLLSPLKVGRFVLKNRMISANSMPHFVQGPEPFPADGTIKHFSNRAKGGACVVTCTGVNNEMGGPKLPAHTEVAHFPSFNIYDGGCQNYMTQLSESIRYYGSIASVGLFSAFNSFPIQMPDGEIELVSVGGEGLLAPPDSIAKTLDTISEETMSRIADSFAQQCQILKSQGFDMVSIHMAYRFQLLGQFISPITNKRTDQFGGSVENRARFPLMVFERIRESVGRDFIIEILISGQEPEGGNTLDDTVAILKMAEKYIDIAQIRAGGLDPNHPTGFCLEETPYLKDAEYIKKSGVDVFIASVGGWQNPDTAEKALAEGKLDLIAMARAWISNPDYGEMVYQGRKDDIVPCLRCNKCHRSGELDPFASICAVNPLIGIEHRVKDLGREPGPPKNIAVIGGGPAGMKVAIDLSDRGHFVTLYEAEDQLGGLLKHSDYVDFKWPLKNFKNYLIRQIEKRHIEVKLNTKATPETIESQKFDIIVAAVGSESIKPPIPGLENRKTYDSTVAMTTPDALGKNVVVIGGGDVGVEAGMVLAANGHHVTVIEMRDRLAADAAPTHYRTMFEEAWLAIPDFHSMVNCRCTEVTESAVICVDEQGEHSIPADSIVVATGMNAKKDEALSFYGTADRFFMIGDCRDPANIQKAMRDAYATASII